MRVVVVSLRLLAATIAMIATMTIAPPIIHVHGTVLVVLVVVVVDISGLVVVFSVVVAEPAFGAAAELLPAAGPLDVVVVLDPLVVPAVCAKVTTGARARNTASKMKIGRQIGRIWSSPVEPCCRTDSLPRKTHSKNTKRRA
jgi:hypothetical protein